MKTTKRTDQSDLKKTSDEGEGRTHFGVMIPMKMVRTTTVTKSLV